MAQSRAAEHTRRRESVLLARLARLLAPLARRAAGVCAVLEWTLWTLCEVREEVGLRAVGTRSSHQVLEAQGPRGAKGRGLGEVDEGEEGALYGEEREIE